MRDADESLFTRRTAIASLAMAIAFAALLYWQGRPLWCKYGLGLWTGAWDHCTSQHLFDPYTLSHVLHGIIFYWLLWPLASKFSLPWRNMTALALEIGWELLENSAWVIERYRQQTAALDYFGDSVLNAVGDVAASVHRFLRSRRDFRGRRRWSCFSYSSWGCCFGTRQSHAQRADAVLPDRSNQAVAA